MQGKSRIGSVALGLVLFAGGGAWAQDDDTALEGAIELLWRNVEVNGNEQKYDEDFDGLASGGRLGNLWLNFVKTEDGKVNYAQVQAQGLGGDPFEFANVRVGANGKWDLRYNRRKQDYIYNLFDSMDDEDGHAWETQREIDEIDLKLYPAQNLDVLVGYSQNDRTGNSLFMKDIARDLFLMDTPVDSERQELYAGVNWRIGEAFDIAFRQTRREFENSFVNSTAGDLGLNQGDTTLLNDFVWDQQEDSAADLTQVTAHFGSRLVDVTVGYHGTLVGEEEFDTVVATEQTGTDFAGAPLNVSGTGDTKTERDLQYLNADVGIYITHWLNLVFEADSLQWDQSSTGTLDLSGSGPTAVDTRWDYSIDTLTGLAELVPTKRLNVQIGGRLIDRELERAGFNAIGGDRDGVFESDGDETLVAAVAWRSQYFQVSGDYEDGSVDTPLTQVSPFDTERFRIRAAVTPQPGMRVEASAVDYENDNDFYAFGSTNEGTITSLLFSNSKDRWNYFLRYSRQDVDSAAMVNFDTAVFGGTEDGTSTFSTDNEQYHAMIRYDGGRWGAFLRFWLAQSDGFNTLVGNVSGPVPNAAISIDQDYVDGEIGVTYTLPSGIWVGAAYRDFDYDDPGHLLRVASDPTRSLDYDGTIVTLRAGYAFGRPKS